MNTQMIKLFKKLRRKPKIEEVYEFGPVVGQYVFNIHNIYITVIIISWCRDA